MAKVKDDLYEKQNNVDDTEYIDLLFAQYEEEHPVPLYLVDEDDNGLYYYSEDVDEYSADYRRVQVDEKYRILVDLVK